MKQDTPMAAMAAGCSALSWSTREGDPLWGRNLDFNRLAAGTAVTYVPAGTQYHFCGSAMEGSQVPETERQARYAAVGTGFLLCPTTPLIYEGVNEAGLMGGQLYFRGFAHYPQQPEEGKLPIQPPMLVYHVLAQCATVEEAARVLEEECTLCAVPLLGTVPPLHWSFTDASGENMVVESDQEGLHIYRKAMGVMTNSPSYAWHRLNLLNYAGLRDLDYDTVEYNGDRQEQCFSGSGAQGLPGDWSSPSRFVRLSFLRQYGDQGAGEQQGVSRMFRLLQSAAFPLGAVRVSQPGQATELDQGEVPFDYTVYTSVMSAKTQRFYWTTYENQRIRCVDLNHLKGKAEPCSFPLDGEEDILCLTRP